jgi:transposase-like protein
VKHRERYVNEAACIYSASSKNEAVKLLWEWAKKWRRIAPKAVTCLEKDIGPLLQFFSTPKHLWKAVRTTNPIERAFREVRRRTTPMGCFNNDESIERTVYGVAIKINKRWIRNHRRCPKPLFAQKS